MTEREFRQFVFTVEDSLLERMLKVYDFLPPISVEVKKNRCIKRTAFAVRKGTQRDITRQKLKSVILFSREFVNLDGVMKEVNEYLAAVT